MQHDRTVRGGASTILVRTVDSDVVVILISQFTLSNDISETCNYLLVSELARIKEILTSDN
jgi:hypothetical protein